MACEAALAVPGKRAGTVVWSGGFFAVFFALFGCRLRPVWLGGGRYSGGEGKHA